MKTEHLQNGPLVQMTKEYLVAALTEGGDFCERPEILTQDEYKEKQKASMAATDGNWYWVILSRVQVNHSDETEVAQ